MYVILFGAAIVQSAAGAVVASAVGVGWSLGCCVGAHEIGQYSRNDGFGAPQQIRWRSWGWLILLAALVSPAATHWVSGRTRSGPLDFANADPRVLDISQTLGWVSVAVVIVGCPVAWFVGRRSPRE